MGPLSPRETLEHDAKSMRSHAADQITEAERSETDAKRYRDRAAELIAQAEEFEAAAKLLPEPPAREEDKAA